MFRFTIRDLLWLTVVVALGVGWYLSARKNERLSSSLAQEQALTAQMRAGFEYMKADLAKKMQQLLAAARAGYLPGIPGIQERMYEQAAQDAIAARDAYERAARDANAAPPQPKAPPSEPIEP